MSIESKLEQIKLRKLELTDDPRTEDDPCRPDLRVWAECYPDDVPHIAFSMGALFSQQQRFVDLTPDEARLLAKHLTAVADEIDAIVDNHEPPDPPGFEAGFAENH